MESATDVGSLSDRGLTLTSKVAVIRFDADNGISLKHGLDLIGGIDDLNSRKRSVAVKVGIFDTEGFHTSVPVVSSIVHCFGKAPNIFIAESDNYRGTGSERLQVWKELFSDRVVPFNLSEDSDTMRVRVADEEVGLSHILFKPNVLVSTHVLRVYERGSILKNLLGLVPDSKKARFHKKLAPALADMFEAVDGIDLAVMDGTYFWRGLGYLPVQTNIILVGRDAVAVETVGGLLASMNLQKMPVLQEFVRRGLGEGDLKNIEIVGASFESLQKEFDVAIKVHKKRKPRSEGPTTWSGRVHRGFKSLMQEGFFKLPNKRTVQDVVKALEAKSIPARGKEEKIEGFLARRVKNGILKKTENKDGQIYWTD